jgi:hypothetical protein
LGQKSSLASSKGQVALLESSIGSVIGRDGFKEISCFSNSFGLMGGLLMEDIVGSREGAEIALSVAEMLKHVGPSTFNGWASIPKVEILMKNWLPSKNDIGKIYHLLWGHWRECMLCKINKIINSIEDSVHWERNVVRHIEGQHFFSSDLLGGNFTVSGKEVQKHGANISGILAGSTIEQGSEIYWINRFNNLRNECLLCSLTEDEGEFELTPYILSGFKLRFSAVNRCGKWAWIRTTNPRNGICQGSTGQRTE